ncbi:uncharacterized protein LOC127286525 [Leptopilina boulardi]|uniref:uncharacterized protein LOC127286525 n=1 Tax=Leptopilina boulardi TaxID=63433 RepID=UPI0021F5FAA4|nr:uncharacterized protein LOC127286525 [Leptopilina boulardi]
MLILTILNLLFYFCVSNAHVSWNEEEIERTVKPSVRKFEDSWRNNIYKGPFFHYKKHFGIIIKKDTTFTLTIETSKIIQNLEFSCPTEISEKFIIVGFGEKGNSTEKFTTKVDCVPLLTVSYNVPVMVKIKTKNWKILPIFDSRNLTLLTSQEPEQEFYKNVETYGFVENYYTQMLLSANDIKTILSQKLNLFIALQNQVDLIKYYNYLTGASRYVNKNDSLSYHLVNKQRFFLRTEKKNEAYAYSGSPWLKFTGGFDDVLIPTRAKEWVLLHEVAHQYDISGVTDGFGNTIDVWTNVFCALYQNKFNLKHYWLSFSESDKNEFISLYHNKGTSTNWNHRQKLHLLMNLFAYDGTDKAFREFNIRYYSKKHVNKYVIISLILEVFFDLYEINLLPFVKKFINFNTNGHLVSQHLEIRLLNGHPVMPAIDFNLKPIELSARSREKDWRQSLPLTLMPKMKKKYVDVTFTIESPIDPRNFCLYLNNNCHNITGKLMNIKLQSDVYSIFIAIEKNGNLYINDVNYHIISQETKIHLIINEITQNSVFLPLVHYEFHALGIGDWRFLNIFINFKTMTIEIQQFVGVIHQYFPKELYFSISLERNDSIIFNYNFFGIQENEQLINVRHKLKVNDKIHMFHAESPIRLLFNSKKYNELKKNTFVITKVGLKDVHDNDFKLISSDIKRIDEFNSKYNMDLANNTLHHILFKYYINKLRFNGLEKYIPNSWV